jgi:RNA polymerase sigma-70 factor (ECF subfamily)
MPAAAPVSRDALARALADEGDRLYALALRVTRDADLAADAVQEAFAAALAHAGEFRGGSRLGTWLHRIVYTKSIDLLRRRQRDVPLDEAGEDAVERRDTLVPTWARPPDEILLGREARAAFDRALEGLTPLQRAVLTLREIEGLGGDETAAILGLSSGSVRVHLHRARMRLQALLAPYFREERR